MSEPVRLLQSKMAEGVGFEPTVGLTQRSISRGAVAANGQWVTKALPTTAKHSGIILCNIGKCWHCVRVCRVPNQRASFMKRTTITVDQSLYAWAMAEAKRRGINDFSTFVRTLIAAEKRNKSHEKDR